MSERICGSLTSGIAGALDDLRHTWERAWFDRKVTGDIAVVETQNPELKPFTMADFYSDPHYNEPYNRHPSQGRSIEPPEIER